MYINAIVKAILLPLLAIVSIPALIRAEKNPFFFNQVGYESGLTENTITDLLQDTDGYIWIGTHNGLFRYDGYTCKVYRNRPDSPNTIGDNSISCIEEDNQQNIWIISEYHVQKIDRQSHRIQKYNIDKAKFMHICKRRKNGELWFIGEKELFIYDPLQDSLVRHTGLSPLPIQSNICAMEEDSEGNLYLASKSSGLLVIDKNNRIQHHYNNDPADPSSLIGGELSNLYIDSHKRLWVSSLKEGICFLDREKLTFTRFDQSNSALGNNVIRCMTEYKPDMLLIGGFSGLALMDCNTFKIRSFDFEPNKNGALTHYSIHTFMKDNNDGLWIGTWNGLNYYNPLRKQISILKPRMFTGVLGIGQEDDDHQMWFVTEGAGLLCYTPTTQTHQNYLLTPTPTQAYNQNILKSLYIKGDSILCATQKGCVFLFSRSQKKYRQLYDFGSGDIYSLLIDSKNRIWIPTNSRNGLVLIENGKQTNEFPVNGKQQKIHFVTACRELSPDRILFGTLTQELYLYDIQKKETKHIELNSLSANQTHKNGRITGICTDPEGNISISTFGNGLFVFNSRLELLQHYLNNNGLNTPYIYTFVTDDKHTLWVLTENGLYYKEYKQEKFNYFPNKQFSNHNFTFHSGTKSQDGILYLPGNKDILCFNPSRIGENNYIPPVYLTDISVNNSPIDLKNAAPLILKSNETNITISYAALDFTEPEQIQYKYKMEGVDTEFNLVGNRRIAYFSNLEPGDYLFQVQACNSNGKWNSLETTLSIRVLPPFYKTNIAYVLYFICLCLVIYAIIHYFKVRNELENDIRFKQMEKEKIKEINEERIRLFTNFSHELRTPLTLISNPLEDLIQNNIFSGEVKKVLYLMQKNTQKVLLLVNNLMDIQKYDSQKMTLQKENFNLADFTRDLYAMFESIARKREITFRLENKIPEAYEVYYDKQEMEKVMFNLLSNAFKFTPENGEVTLRISSVSQKNAVLLVSESKKTALVEDYYLHIEVQDNGTGIELKELDNIFQPFYRSSQDLHHQIAGSGIGLSLVRFIIEQHQGIIRAESNRNLGTRMHVLLPLLEKPIIRQQPVGQSLIENKVQISVDDLQKRSPSRQSILFVEDNTDVLSYLEGQFKEYYSVYKARNGEEALVLLKIQKVDLIVSDIMMPKTDGIELCKRIKKSDKWSHIPLILLTAKTMPSQIAEGFKAGADEYIVKPYDISHLRSRIQNLLNSRKQIQKKFEKKLELEAFGIQISDQDELFLTQYTNIIKKNFSNPDFNMDDICKEIGVSRAQFYRKIKAQTGVSPADMIKKIRLEAAAQMLRETDLNISEIQEKVAFSNSGYFASCFKQVYGLSPKEYRNTNKS